jgi:hypothetical protein
MPRGGSTSPFEEYTQQILALNREQPDRCPAALKIAAANKKTRENAFAPCA